MSPSPKKRVWIEADLNINLKNEQVKVYSEGKVLKIHLPSLSPLKQIPFKKRDLFFSARQFARNVNNPIVVILEDKEWIKIDGGRVKVQNWTVTLKYLLS